MPFQVGNGCFPAAISDSRITRIARSDTPPETSVWKKIKAFFCSTNKPETLECIRKICHPPAGTTREKVARRFEQLRTLAYGGFKENVQFDRHGENHFCILDENNREMLSVTLDGNGKYTLKCQGYSEIHSIISDAEHAAATKAAQAAKELQAVWSAWERAAPHEEAKYRTFVVRILRQLQNDNSRDFHLFNINISSLPDHLPPCIDGIQIDRIPLTNLPALPHWLTKLVVCNAPLASLPDRPDRLLYMNTMTSLPALPYGLKKLKVSNICLTSLPALPDGLKSLTISGTSLTRLPALPDRLKSLTISGTSLTRLPALPDRLTYLEVSNMSLTSLPALSDGLEHLEVNNIPLSSLPELPDSLARIRINNTSVTRLPESITRLSPNVRVDISNNPLSERTRQDLEAMTRAPDYSGPQITFNMAGPSVPRESRPLHLAAVDWLRPANESMPDSTNQWRAFGQENDAVSFSAFLDRLSETENAKKDAGFKAQTVAWLAQLAEDNELRAKTFAMATEATSSCEDRVTLALNQMKNVQLLHNAEKGAYDNNLPELVSTGREMFRLETLEKIAREKVSTLRFVDEIEVYLGYQNKLKEKLLLTSVTKEMRFFGVSGITESDLQAAERQVKDEEDSQFREWILQWAPLRSVLERTVPERWEALCEKKIADYNDAFRILSETELKPAWLAGNTDAERAVGARAMERAEQAFRDGLRPLAENMVGKYLKVQWS